MKLCPIKQPKSAYLAYFRLSLYADFCPHHGFCPHRDCNFSSVWVYSPSVLWSVMDFVLTVTAISALLGPHSVGFVHAKAWKRITSLSVHGDPVTPSSLVIHKSVYFARLVLSDHFLGRPCFKSIKAATFRTLALMLTTVGLFLTGIGLIIALF